MSVSTTEVQRTIDLPMGSVIARSRTILSVSPVDCRKTLNHEPANAPNSRFHEYILPGAPKKGYSTLKVYDARVWVLNRNSVSDDHPGDIEPMPMPAEVIAPDLIRAWTQGAIGARGGVIPGIVLCAGDEPTKDEIAKANAMHEAYCRSAIKDGNDLFNQGNQRNITEEHRRCAEWMEVAVPWRVEMTRADMKACPSCAEQIASPALKCKYCNEFLPEFYVKYDLNTQNDPVVHRHLLARSVKAVPQQSKPTPGAPINPPVK